LLDELIRVVRACAAVGFRKIRLTGGEPTRYDAIWSHSCATSKPSPVSSISPWPTTNAVKLSPIAHDLQQAGLDRVNISIDLLDAERFRTKQYVMFLRMYLVRYVLLSLVDAGFKSPDIAIVLGTRTVIAQVIK
jgi:molybdenum cofactor biosynthesis enzyme MoaA